jgi:hypothetical protein
MKIGTLENIQKRKAKRFICLQRASIDTQGIKDNVQIRDISETGLAFFSNTHIQNNSPIVLNWNNAEKSSFIPYIVIVRKIAQPSDGIFRNCYGTKFTNLRQETKDTIQQIVSKVQEQEMMSSRILLEKIGLKALADIIKQGRSFLHLLLKEPEAHKYLQPFTKEIRKYERTSFENRDELSLAVQKLTMHHFHCLLLFSIIQPDTKTHSTPNILQEIVLEKIGAIANYNIELKKIPSSPAVEESKNRLYYSRLDLLKNFVESFQFDFKTTKNKELQSIGEEYHLLFPQSKPRR